MPEHMELDPRSGTVTLTITPDLSRFRDALERSDRSLRATSARMRGMPRLADVIEQQPGRAIVREGMADVLAWLGGQP